MASRAKGRFFEYRHLVSFEETNLVGNVYYANFVRWQGRCRELFLHSHAPGILEEISQGLALATVRCSCEYLAEVAAFDLIAVRMRLEELRQNRLRFQFEYWRCGHGGSEELVARGEQEVACMRRQGGSTVPAPIPPELEQALQPFLAGFGPK